MVVKRLTNLNCHLLQCVAENICFYTSEHICCAPPLYLYRGLQMLQQIKKEKCLLFLFPLANQPKVYFEELTRTVKGEKWL